VGGRRRSRTVLHAERTEICGEIVVGEHKTTTATKSGWVEDGTRGLILGVVPWGIETDDDWSPWLYDGDAMSATGRATSAAAVFVLGRVHARPKLTQGRTVVQKDLPDVTYERAHV
jgi:hypothetical protein